MTRFEQFLSRLAEFDGSIEHSEHVNIVIKEFTNEDIKQFNGLLIAKRLNSTNFSDSTYWLSIWYDVDYHCRRFGE